MADPITIGIGIGSLVAGGASMFANSGQQQQQQQAAPTAPAALPPDPSSPAIAPGSKPAKKSQQQSFLSGAAGLQRDAGQGTGSSGGKSLLGQ